MKMLQDSVRSARILSEQMLFFVRRPPPFYTLEMSHRYSVTKTERQGGGNCAWEEERSPQKVMPKKMKNEGISSLPGRQTQTKIQLFMLSVFAKLGSKCSIYVVNENVRPSLSFQILCSCFLPSVSCSGNVDGGQFAKRMGSLAQGSPGQDFPG